MPLNIHGDTIARSLQRSLNQTSNALNQATERLASGYRILSARDDAAGASVATRLEASVRGTSRAIQNASTAVSTLRTADAALDEQTALLQRLREMAVQSGSGTLSSAQRSLLETESAQLRTELDRIGAQTSFNGIKLLDGSFSGKHFQLSDGFTTEATPFTVSLEASNNATLRVERQANSIATVHNFESPAGSTVSFDLNGTTISYIATGATDQAGNATALVAALNAASATLSPLQLGWYLGADGESVVVTRNAGDPIEFTNLDPGGSSAVTNTAFATSIDGAMTTNRQGLDATTYLDGNNGAVGSFAVAVAFTENDIDIGAPAIGTVNFAQSAVATEGALTGLALGDQLEGHFGTNLDTGDSFDATLTRNDGTLTTYTYTMGSATDTLNDFITAFNGANPNYSLSISGGALRLVEANPTAGTALNITLGNYIDAAAADGAFTGDTFSQTSEAFLTSTGQLTGPFGTATALASIAEFSNVQGGDTLDITLTDEAGGSQDFTFTFAGAINAASTSTVNDLITSLSAQTNIVASYDSTLGIVIRDNSGGTAGNIAFSFGPGNLTERFSAADGSNATVSVPGLSFTTSGRTLTSGTLTAGSVPITLTTTQLNNLDGFANIEGDDGFAITLTNFLGASTVVNVTATDVTAGNASALTIGDLITAIDGTTVGASTFSASLSAGVITVTEHSSLRGIGATFEVGDTIDVAVSANDGSALGTGTYTFTGATDSWDDLRTFIEGIASVTGAFENNRLVFREDARTAGTAVGVTLSNYIDAASANGSFTGATFGSNGSNKVTTSSVFSAPFTPASLVNSIAEFDDINAGDQLVFRMTNGLGANRDFTYTFGGTFGDLTTDTFQDLIDEINLQADMNAVYDATINHIVIEDTSNDGTGVSFSFSMADFSELAGIPIIHQLEVTADSYSTGSAVLNAATTETTVRSFDYDISTVDGATLAITSVDEAIRRLNLSRAGVGALLSRIETRVSRLSAYEQAIAVAKGQIMDADFARETAELTSAEIKTASATSLFAADRRLRQLALSVLESALVGPAGLQSS